MALPVKRICIPLLLIALSIPAIVFWNKAPGAAGTFPGEETIFAYDTLRICGTSLAADMVLLPNGVFDPEFFARPGATLLFKTSSSIGFVQGQTVVLVAMVAPGYAFRARMDKHAYETLGR